MTPGGTATELRARAKGAAARAGLVPPADLVLHSVVRYEPVLRLVRELGGGTLLEAGSAHRGIRGNGLTEPEWDVTAVDMSFDNYGQAGGSPPDDCRAVVGDVRALPFEDRSFDVVVALDLLEHLDAGDRPVALRELARVARRRVIVGCPTGTDALEADRRLADFYREHGQVPAWLTEHLENGFPEVSDLTLALEPFGRPRVVRNESVSAHERVLRSHVRHGGRRWATQPVRALAALLRAHRWSSTAPGRLASGAASRLLWAVRGGDRPPAYRTIVVVDVGDSSSS
jgi:hypothetical protein